MKIVLIILLFFNLSNLSARTLSNRTICPNITDETQTLVINLQTIHDQLKSQQKCLPLAERISTINQVISNKRWKKFKKIISGKVSSSLEGEEIEELQALSQKIGHSIAQTIDLLKGPNASCMPKNQKASFLNTLSGVTREVATIIGNVTGPYGIAISLGGNILSHSIAGIDKIFTERKTFNFKNKSEELLFMNQFCAFNESQKDVIDFLKMEDRILELAQLEDYLKLKKKDLLSNCPLCNAYNIAWKAKSKSEKIVMRIKEDANLFHETQTQENVSYSKCTEIARAVHTSDSDLKQFFNIFKEYKNPAMSKSDRELMAQVVDAESVIKDIFPTLKDCYLLKPSEKIEVAQNFNNFLRDDILPLKDTIFDQQLKSFRSLANKKYKNPLGDYIALTIDRSAWLKSQDFKIKQKLEDPNRSNDTEIVREMYEKLQRRMISELMPQYLKFAIKRNKKYLSNFIKEFSIFRKHELKYFSKNFNPSPQNMTDLLAILKNNKKVDARIYLTRQRTTVNKLEIALDQSQNIKRYCEYLKYVVSSNDEINKNCNMKFSRINELYDSLIQYNSDLKAMQDFDKWASTHLEIQSSRVLDYADHIRNWQNRQDERWEEKYVEIPSAFEIIPISDLKENWERKDNFVEK